MNQETLTEDHKQQLIEFKKHLSEEEKMDLDIFISESREMLISNGSVSDIKLARVLEFMEFTYLQDLLEEVEKRKLN